MQVQQLDNLVRARELHAEPPDQNELNGMFQDASAWLKDANNVSLSLVSRFVLAYDAAHALSLAALRWHGYRPTRNRYIVFQCLEHTVRFEKGRIRFLSMCHDRRNRVHYEGSNVVDEQMVKELLDVASALAVALDQLGPVRGDTP